MGELPAEILRRLCHSVLDHQQGQLQDDATLLLLVWIGPLSQDARVVKASPVPAPSPD